MTKADVLFRVSVVLLLAAILTVQCLILKATNDARPPTLGESLEAQGDARRELYLRRPMVQVSGSVDID
jgi:hypothetical protein